MRPTRTPRIKICCIGSVDEALLAIECGASAVGLVSEMPSGPGVISEERIAEIASRIPPPIGSFLLTSKQDVANIIAQHRRCRTNCIQLCDRLTKGSHRDLKAALPGISIVQVIHVTVSESIAEAVAVASSVDALLLDSGNQSLLVKELGGTGRTHNWALSRQIREHVDVPVFLAGGLSSSNVRQAIEDVGSFGLDLCSGVRTNGELDRVKLTSFFDTVRAAAHQQVPLDAFSPRQSPLTTSESPD
ncbi:MAG: phosphoribosylanthranilate isomerase [Acidobacteriia bacterium]|nr:phosphoribosylanthranilate isomerase [Terriglobia bacterium]